jgi:hypothetical protein
VFHNIGEDLLKDTVNENFRLGRKEVVKVGNFLNDVDIEAILEMAEKLPEGG